MDPDEDRLLLEKTAAGDARAFDAFVRRWEGPLFRFLRRTTGSDSLAEDARQVTLLRVYRHASSFRGGSVPAWLFRAAYRAASSLARRDARRDAPLDAALELHDAAPSPPANASAVEERDALARSLARLAPEDRALLWLRVGEGLTLDETSRALDVAPSTLRYRFERAIERLRRDLAPVAEPRRGAPARLEQGAIDGLS